MAAPRRGVPMDWRAPLYRVVTGRAGRGMLPRASRVPRPVDSTPGSPGVPGSQSPAAARNVFSIIGCDTDASVYVCVAFARLAATAFV